LQSLKRISLRLGKSDKKLIIAFTEAEF
jgi:hypothetical protein